jgi:hypothetical protein
MILFFYVKLQIDPKNKSNEKSSISSIFMNFAKNEKHFGRITQNSNFKLLITF